MTRSEMDEVWQEIQLSDVSQKKIAIIILVSVVV